MTAAADLPPPGATVLVHGLGRFGGGREAVRFLAKRGCCVRVADRSDGDDLQAVRHALRDLPGIDWQLGREDEALLDDVAVLLVNPGVPDAHPLLTAAHRRAIPTTQEVDLFLAAYPGTVVGVTGTNGKSTTSTLLHAALQRAGTDALLGGNIGHSLLADEATWRQDQVAVLEISSFQLERLHADRRVTGAVYTRVGRDHVDRHGTLVAYHAAKARLAAAATGFVVHAADDPVADTFATAAQQRLRYAATRPAPCSTGLLDGFVATRLDADAAEPIVHKDALRLLGEFQVENVMAAATAARWLGAPPHAIGLALAHAAALPFRLQQVAVVDGVRVFDNAVSTEIESTRSALRALTGRVHWVGGGKSKDGDYAGFAAAIAAHVTSAHLFGAAAAPLAAQLPRQLLHGVHERLGDALAGAFAAAAPGDAVLFSPGFASFDQYPNFRARALEFHAWLAARRERGAAQQA